ncbi:MAG: hypothetical protein KAT68_11465 [Bacteroidales bacterium]|nr:hypothetical protein [Bacteroidales bacterium]
MKKQKIGIAIFTIGVLLMIIMGGIASWSVCTTFRNLSMEEVNKTIWAVPCFLFFLWAFSVPVGAILASIGMLIYGYRGVKSSRIWLIGITIFLVSFLIIYLPIENHYPFLFGIGGCLILLFFFGIFWLWGKKRFMLKGSEKLVADFQLIAYVFLLIAMWLSCGALGKYHMKALADVTSSPIDIMIFFVLASLFLFLSHYKSNRLKDN